MKFERAYFAEGPFASDPGQPVGNRSRCNTGDSSYGGSSTNSDSSSSRGGERGIGSNGVNGLVVSMHPNGPRRRSHRPRGCRGGRKNRKSQQAKAAALLPKEILDGPGPLSPRAGNVQNKPSLQTKGPRQSIRNATSGMAPDNMWKQEPLSTNSSLQQYQQQPKIWSRNGQESTGGLPFMNHHSSASSAAFYSSRAVSANPQQLSAAQLPTSAPDTSYHNPRVDNHPHLFRPLQPETARNNRGASPTETDLNMQLHLSFMTSSRHNSNGHGRVSKSSSPPCDILPPLPSGSMSMRESPPLPMMEGPNPYALGGANHVVVGGHMNNRDSQPPGLPPRVTGPVAGYLYCSCGLLLPREQ